MNDEDALFDALAADSADESPRLVLADYYEERGDPRADYLRALHALELCHPASAEFVRLSEEELRLRRTEGVTDLWLDRLNAVDARPYRDEWELLTEFPEALCDSGCRALAWRAARNLARRCRRNVALITDRLRSMGYDFALPEEAWQPLSPRVLVEIDRRQSQERTFLPVLLQAWLREVGTVNWIGTMTDWPTLAFMPEYREYGVGYWLTRPLAFDFTGVAEALAERARFVPIGVPDDEKYYTRRIRWNAVGLPTSLGFVLDGAYSDTGTGFLEHLRLAFAWGGFPGFATIDNRPQGFLDELTRGLAAI